MLPAGTQLLAGQLLAPGDPLRLRRPGDLPGGVLQLVKIALAITLIEGTSRDDFQKALETLQVLSLPLQ